MIIKACSRCVLPVEGLRARGARGQQLADIEREIVIAPGAEHVFRHHDIFEEARTARANIKGAEGRTAFDLKWVKR